MPARYSTLLLDADETLFDFLKAEQSSLETVLAARGLPHGAEILQRYHVINDALWHAFERGEITKEDIKKTRFAKLAEQSGFPAGTDTDEINGAYLRQLGESDFLLPGARAFLQTLYDAGFDLVLITNGVAQTQLRRLEKSGLAPLFSHVFVSEAVGAQKPLRAFFDAVLDAIDEKDKARVLVIGDSLMSDIRGAYNAGLDCVWYNPKGAANDAGLPVTAMARTYKEIEAFLGL
jgi:2-haloacid dehalogenase